MTRARFARAGRSAVLIATLAVGAVARGAEPTPVARDTLVYKDGDRVQGKLVEQVGGVLVFKADRFGELRVPAADAVVIKAGQPVAAPGPAAPAAPLAAAPAASKPAAVATMIPAAAPASVAAKPAAAPAPRREGEGQATNADLLSAQALTARVRSFFGPWHGRVSFGTEIVNDVAKRNNSSYETLVRRKWTADEVQLNARFDYNKTNELATADLMKAGVQWRHDFSKAFFLQYRPSSEWNRASLLLGRPNDYVLVQQEIGAGYLVITKPSHKVRFGISQNRFDTWNSSLTPTHATRSVQSLFEEVEINLPWRMTIAQRGVWYPVPERIDGWENRFDFNKKLTETLSTSLRHEIRRHNPDGSAPDYTRLKLLFGLDF